MNSYDWLFDSGASRGEGTGPSRAHAIPTFGEGTGPSNADAIPTFGEGTGPSNADAIPTFGEGTGLSNALSSSGAYSGAPPSATVTAAGLV